MSDLASESRFLLIGEPGSGKTSVFSQAATDCACKVVTAREFVKGQRPEGHVVFIDALDEFRIGEVGRDRLYELAEALGSSQYAHWRIACRAVSMPPTDALPLAKYAGDFRVWELQPLDRREQLSILRSLGEIDPEGFVRSIDSMAAGPLLENPATLILLRDTLRGGVEEIRTRGALFERATYLMAHEINPGFPERSDRPQPSRIVEAAERASLILLLSAKTEIWALSVANEGETAVTFDDLLPAEIDTAALRVALDTAMFRGEGGSFQPAHRIVAEYLGGRALAAATLSRDPRRPSLSLRRALAFLCDDDDKPAPGLNGIFAWFVTTLASTEHADRALELVRANPELVLLHGDAALLPTLHRRALLDAVGREDPWFLSQARGSTAIGGLACDDVAEDLKAILVDPTETFHRRAMVLRALESGRPIAVLQPVLKTIALDSTKVDSLRHHAIEAYVAGRSNPIGARRELLDQLNLEPARTSTGVRLHLMPDLVGMGATADEIRLLLTDHMVNVGHVVGSLWPLREALLRCPLPELFDKPMPGADLPDGSWNYDLRSTISSVLAACIRITENLSVERLVSWFENVGLIKHGEPDEEVRHAIRGWLDSEPSRPAVLFWALAARVTKGQEFMVAYHFSRLSGSPPRLSLVDELIDCLQAPGPSERLGSCLGLLFGFTREIFEDPPLYWRLWNVLYGRQDYESAFQSLTLCPLDFHPYNRSTAERDRERAERRTLSQAEDKARLNNEIADIRSGVAIGALQWAALVYLGYERADELKAGINALRAWCGDEITNAIILGWDLLSSSFPLSVAELGRSQSKDRLPYMALLAAAWLDYKLDTNSLAVLSPRVAFAALIGALGLKDQDRRKRVEDVAATRIAAGELDNEILLTFWRAAIDSRAARLPAIRFFYDEGFQANWAITDILSRRPGMSDSVLSEAVEHAARVLAPGTIRTLATRALTKKLRSSARRLWRFVAFMVDPSGNADAFDRELADPEAHQLFDRYGQEGSTGDFAITAMERVVRDEIVVRRLGAVCSPNFHEPPLSNSLSQAVSRGISSLAASPSVEASTALLALASLESLTEWRDTLRHHAASQAELRRRATFHAPDPADVAVALLAGAPATAADLRAVIGEQIDALAHDVRNGNTSPWRGFWNYPGHDQAQPKPENDCRDLLTDRLRDRLMRYGVRATGTSTETRSADDRRADVLILGEGDAAVPIEAKRHYNPQVWTGVEEQLRQYIRTAASSGHGIYLVFWFGTDRRPVPPGPHGEVGITTPGELKAALLRNLAPEEHGKIEIVVFDVSQPATARQRRGAVAFRPADR